MWLVFFTLFIVANDSLDLLTRTETLAGEASKSYSGTSNSESCTNQQPIHSLINPRPNEPSSSTEEVVSHVPSPIQQNGRTTTVIVAEESQIGIFPAPAQESSRGHPHRRDFDKIPWYWLLQIMIFYQLLFLTALLFTLSYTYESGAGFVQALLPMSWRIANPPVITFGYIASCHLFQTNGAFERTFIWSSVVFVLCISTAIDIKWL